MIVNAALFHDFLFQCPDSRYSLIAASCRKLARCRNRLFPTTPLSEKALRSAVKKFADEKGGGMQFDRHSHRRLLPDILINSQKGLLQEFSPIDPRSPTGDCSRKSPEDYSPRNPIVDCSGNCSRSPTEDCSQWSHRGFLQKFPPKIAPDIHIEDCFINSHGDCSRKHHCGFLHEFHLGTAPGNPTGDYFRNAHRRFLQEFSLGIPPRVLFGNSFGSSLREFLQEFPLKIPPGVSFGDFSKRSFPGIHQKFLPGIHQEFPLDGNSSRSFLW